MSGDSMEIPKYRCHKVAHALKIAKVMTTDRVMLVPEDKRFAPFEVELEFVRRTKLVEGGYYVVYEDGYKSFSPAKAFEDGYTLIDATAPDPKTVGWLPTFKFGDRVEDNATQTRWRVWDSKRDDKGE